MKQNEKIRPIIAKKFHGKMVNYIGLLPFFAIFIIFILYPFIYGIVMSFTNWSVHTKGKPDFVGLSNYLYVLSGKGTSSTRFLKSLRNLLIYVPITLLIGLTLALVLALILSQIPKGSSFFRASWFAPYVLPLFICAGIWQWFMTPGTGLVANLLARIGIGRGVDWANTQFYAIMMVVFIDVWNSVGFNFVMIYAGIKDISPDLYEAAELDGASTIKKMRYITIPLLKPILFVVVTYGIISALQVYDVPWILSGTGDYNNIGGPGQVMLFPVMEMVRNIYLGSESGLGRATAEGVILMIIIMAITAVQFSRRRKDAD